MPAAETRSRAWAVRSLSDLCAKKAATPVAGSGCLLELLRPGLMRCGSWPGGCSVSCRNGFLRFCHGQGTEQSQNDGIGFQPHGVRNLSISVDYSILKKLVTELHVAMHLRMHKCHDAGRQTLRALVLNIACCQTSPALHSTAATQKETGKRGQDLVAGRRAIVITWWSPFIPLPHPAHSRRRLSSTVCPNRHTAATNASHVRCLSLPSPHVGPTTSLET